MTSSLYSIVLPTVTTAVSNWNHPTMGPFSSRFVCESDSTCDPLVKAASIALHSVGMVFGWSYLISLDLLQIIFAMYTTQTLKVRI